MNATIKLDSLSSPTKFSSPPKKKLRSSLNECSDKEQANQKEDLATVERSPHFVGLENPLPSSDDTNKNGISSQFQGNENQLNHNMREEGVSRKNEEPGPSPETELLQPRRTVTSSGDRKKGVRRSKRRSSFITGRISKSFSAAKTPDLFADISPDLPQDKRLELLHSKAMENVLQTMEESFPDLPNFAEFRIKALDSAETTINSLCERGDFIKATAPPEVLLNDAQGKTLEENIRQAESEIKRFNAESEKWDKILAEYKQLAEEAERLHQSTPDSSLQVTTESVPVLSKSQQAVLDDCIDVKSLYAQLQTLCEKQVLCIDAISNKVKLQTELFREADHYVQTQAQLIASQSFPLLETDPKVLIKNVTKDMDSSTTTANSA